MATDLLDASTIVEDRPSTFPVDDRQGRFELIDGELREKPAMGALANLLTTRLIIALGSFVASRGLGYCFSQECGYQIFPRDPRRYRYPDASFIRADRLGDQPFPSGYMRIAPDLVIEVVSPNDLAENLEERISDYLGAGVPLIWVLYPSTRKLYVIRGDGSARWIGVDGQLEGESVVPGFSLRLGDLFDGLVEPEAQPKTGDESR